MRYNKASTCLSGLSGASVRANSCKENSIYSLPVHEMLRRRYLLYYVPRLWILRRRKKLGLRRARSTEVIAGLRMLQADPESRELVLTDIRPNIDVGKVTEPTGFKLTVGENLKVTELPA